MFCVPPVEATPSPNPTGDKGGEMAGTTAEQRPPKGRDAKQYVFGNDTTSPHLSEGLQTVPQISSDSNALNNLLSVSENRLDGASLSQVILW